ncbi:hypothetical protein FQN50_005577 [Emmonsiellopsis sp. PD_5]|nr:hypothetical protein FQN50_005577 [Emmonsiellopsis sp. PD_5]
MDADFDDPSGPLLGIITAAFSIGVVWCWRCPWYRGINDRFGRRMCIVFGNVVIVIGVVLQTTSANVGMFLAARLVLGMGIPFAIAGESLLIAELAYPKERAVITGRFNKSWYVGAIIAAGATLGTFSMQVGLGMEIAFAAIVSAFVSPAVVYLVVWRPLHTFPVLDALLYRPTHTVDRADEAFDILATYHAKGNRDDPFVQAEFEQIRETISLEVESSKTGWLE